MVCMGQMLCRTRSTPLSPGGVSRGQGHKKGGPAQSSPQPGPGDWLQDTMAATFLLSSPFLTPSPSVACSFPQSWTWRDRSLLAWSPWRGCDPGMVGLTCFQQGGLCKAVPLACPSQLTRFQPAQALGCLDGSSSAWPMLCSARNPQSICPHHQRRLQPVPLHNAREGLGPHTATWTVRVLQVPVHRGRDHGRCRPGPSGGSKGGGLFLILPGAAFWPHPPLCSWHCHIQNTGSQLCPVPGAGARKHLGISWSRQLSGKHRQGFRCPLPDKDGEHSTPTPCPAGQQCDFEEAMTGGPCSLRQRSPCWSSSPCGRRGWVTTALGWVQSISDLQDWPHPPEKDLASSGVTVPPTSCQQ